MSDFFPLLAWIILGLGIFLGTIGTIIPGLPGAMFIVIALVSHKYLLPDVFSWGLIAFITILGVLTWLADLAMTVLGAKLGGATKYGVYGASIGGLLGLFGGALGIIIGPFIGAVVGDIFAKRRELAKLLKSGIGASLSVIFALLARLLLLLVMVISIVCGIIF